MLELKKEGLYIANGKNISVLIRVVGEAPCLQIVSGVLLNDMVKNGTVKVLNENSIEIQDILCNPKNYIFDLPSVSEAVNTSGIDSDANIEQGYTDEQFERWTSLYKDYKGFYPNNHRVKMQIHLMRKGFSTSQANHIIEKMEEYLRWNGL